LRVISTVECALFSDGTSIWVFPFIDRMVAAAKRFLPFARSLTNGSGNVRPSLAGEQARRPRKMEQATVTARRRLQLRDN
jgi:hypothetical protein